MKESTAPMMTDSLVNAAAATNKTTPLHCAASGGKIHNVLLLLNHGAGINAQMNDGSTALHVACGARHHEVAEVLFL